jgi:Transposase
MSVYVGIDVHRKRSQVAVIDQSGEVLTNRNVPNGPEPILKVIGGLPGTRAAFEACYGTSWLVQLLEDYGLAPHLVHPSRCKTIASDRLKNDKVDAAILAQLLRANLLPEAWITVWRGCHVSPRAPRASRGSSPSQVITLLIDRLPNDHSRCGGPVPLQRSVGDSMS